MFDTYQAAKLLNFSRLALAFLLQHYCDVVVNKEYQVADWRMRPLPQEMIDYARSDTHYLIYIYRRMKKDLLDRSIGNNLLVATWESSRHTCLKRYRIQKIGPDSHLELCRQSRRVFNNRQLYALKELFVWRDKVAREEDESVGFVLPKHMLLQIAEVLPREMQGILACCNPIPTLVRQHLLALHNIILRAREVPLAPLLENGGPLALPKPILAPLEQDMEDPLHCIHDLTRSQDIRDDLPTLLGSPSAHLTDARLVSNTNGDRVSVTSKDVPAVQLFDDARKDADQSPSLAVTFETPYQRYTRTKAMEQAAIRVEQKATQERMENVYQHFRAVVDSSATGDQSAEGHEEQIDDDRPAESAAPTESAAPAQEEAKKKKPDSKNQPLSKQLPSKKRKKRNKAAGMASDGQQNKQVSQGTANETETTGTSATSNTKSSPKKKKLRSEGASSAADAPDEPAAPFTAFDYSQVNFQNFQRPKVQKHLQRGKRGGRGRHLGNRMMRNSGAKSMTYSNKKQ
jgi:exosome complex exonuclease RRP6